MEFKYNSEAKSMHVNAFILKAEYIYIYILIYKYIYFLSSLNIFIYVYNTKWIHMRSPQQQQNCMYCVQNIDKMKKFIFPYISKKVISYIH